MIAINAELSLAVVKLDGNFYVEWSAMESNSSWPDSTGAVLAHKLRAALRELDA